MIIDLKILEDVVTKIKRAKVLVIGDLALDEMVYGNTERISREAPVLILQHTHTKYILGAASNAANNVAALNNNQVSVIGVIGNDYQGQDLKKAFEKAGINCNSLIVDKERKTITKTRISGSCSHSIIQQIVRIDRQTNSPLSKDTEDKMIEQVENLVPENDIIILSDYHIGTLTDRVINAVIETAKKYSVKVIVDTQKDFDRYKGVYSMTPNLPDTQKHIGYYLNKKEDFIKAGKSIIEQISSENILITCGADGMVLIEKGDKYTHIPVFNKSEVFDVTGAGDTVTATFALALAVGAEPVYAAILGNVAAGIVVKQFGCATTTTDEILASIPRKIKIHS